MWGNRAVWIVIMLLGETAEKTESLRALLAYPDFVFRCVENGMFTERKHLTNWHRADIITPIENLHAPGRGLATT